MVLPQAMEGNGKQSDKNDPVSSTVAHGLFSTSQSIADTTTPPTVVLVTSPLLTSSQLNNTSISNITLSLGSGLTSNRGNVMSTKSMPVSNGMTTNGIQVNSMITSNSLSLSNGTHSINMPTKNGKTPTCKVCNDESSGYHYGVDSCEGCKGFFRRCITQGMTHKCSNEEKCEITPFTRNSCQYCRLKKCFAVGMSRDASRLGRRPKRLKSTTGEVKRETNLPIAPYPSPSELYKLRMAELQRLLQQNGTFKSELMQAFLSAAQVSFREHQRNNNTTNTDNHKNNKTPSKKNSGKGEFSTDTQSPSDSSTTSELIDVKTGIIETLDNYKSPDSDVIQTDNNHEYTPMTPMTSTTSDITPDIKIEPGLDNSVYSMSNMMDSASPFFSEMSPDTMMMMPDMMGMMDDNSMMANMMSSLMNAKTPEQDDNANEIDVDRIMEEVRQVPSELREQLINQVISTVGEAHLATVRPTYARVAEANERFAQKILDHGMPDLSKLSIDPNAMWQKFTASLVLEITNVVKFCKKLPGFGEIETEDQIILIKKGSFEVLLVRMCLLVDHEKQEMFDPDMEMKCPRQMVRKMPLGPFIEEFFNVAAQINPLKLTDVQLGIFSACLIMCPEREGINQVPAIEKLYSLFLQSLYMDMKNTHSNLEDQFARLLSIIPVFKNMNKKHSMALNSMKMQKTEALEDFPELHKEVFDIKDD